MESIYYIEWIGVLFFALSGALGAINKKMDLFGVFIIAFVSSNGGGTLRDLLLGRTPVFWMKDPSILFAVALGSLLAVLLYKKLNFYRKKFFIFDAMGLGVFTLTGIQISHTLNLNPVIGLTVATITAVFGGIIRDVLLNEIPLIFHKEIYAFASIAGSLFYGVLYYMHTPELISYILTIVFVFVFRLLIVKYQWRLPRWHIH